MSAIATDVIDKLNLTVDQFVAEGRMFTGYDVTVETREREKIKLRHSDVRGEIHNLPSLRDEFEFGDYERHEVDMPGGGWAWVYHLSTDDPNQYTPQNTQKKLPSVSGTLSSSDDDVVTAQDSGCKLGDGKYVTDYRNRLMVPKAYLCGIDLNPGNHCYVFHDVSNNKLVVTSDDSHHHSHLFVGTYKVERNGDIRLSSKSLKTIGAANRFQIESDNGNVIITAV